VTQPEQNLSQPLLSTTGAAEPITPGRLIDHPLFAQLADHASCSPPYPSTTAKIPPTTRKRKAAEATIASIKADKLPNKRTTASTAAAATIASAEAAPPTPVTGMDSDEDFVSTISSDEDVMQDDTDGGDVSGAEGGLLCFANSCRGFTPQMGVCLSPFLT
jgi:hypothetical protein